MAKDRLSGKLAVILHADVAGSTAMVQQDEQLAHERIQGAFRRFSETIEKYHGHILELRGDALLAQFESASDAVTATLAFQSDHTYLISRLKDDLRPAIRVGIAMGEVVIADNTVTGSGVVLAQRVEQLADPGGVCITAAIHEALPRRMPFDLENLGEQVLKGFDDPIRVYRVELSANQSVPAPRQSNQHEASPKKPKLIVAIIVTTLVIAGGAAFWVKTQVPQEEPASVENMAYPLPDKPSIAVLPFTNMSNDSQQEYFADGMTEDLITDISKVSGLFVIARNSVFTYKGKAVKVRQVAEELGVRYVMEGSVRRVGNQVRINAQLIDATTGGHIWADRYDGSLDDVFLMQDKITKHIVTSLSVILTEQDRNNRYQDHATSPEAYDAFLQGWGHFKRQTPKDYAAAHDYYKRALEIDPQYKRVFAALAALYFETGNRQWSAALGIGTRSLRQRTFDNLAKADAESSVIGLVTASKVHSRFGRNEAAMSAAERAIKLEPNSAEAQSNLAELLIYTGLPEQALEPLSQAMRFDPLNQSYLFFLKGLAEFGLERFETAAISLSKALELNPEYKPPAAILAAAYIYLNRPEDASGALEVFQSEYTFLANTSSMTLVLFPYKSESDKERLVEALLKAGLPEY
jgi:TolB-like protein/class 3 adenylate cyclase/thioredoxin-like negative regulator of GroEL